MCAKALGTVEADLGVKHIERLRKDDTDMLKPGNIIDVGGPLKCWWFADYTCKPRALQVLVQAELRPGGSYGVRVGPEGLLPVIRSSHSVLADLLCKIGVGGSEPREPHVPVAIIQVKASSQFSMPFGELIGEMVGKVDLTIRCEPAPKVDRPRVSLPLGVKMAPRKHRRTRRSATCRKAATAHANNRFGST